MKSPTLSVLVLRQSGSIQALDALNAKIPKSFGELVAESSQALHVEPGHTTPQFLSTPAVAGFEAWVFRGYPYMYRRTARLFVPDSSWPESHILVHSFRPS
ncbi:hypothetical protein IWZ00DRAFT_280219 [Phyllosticta capitalensis]